MHVVDSNIHFEFSNCLVVSAYACTKNLMILCHYLHELGNIPFSISDTRSITTRRAAFILLSLIMQKCCVIAAIIIDITLHIHAKYGMFNDSPAHW